MNKLIIGLLIIILVLISGCNSYRDCYNNCIRLNREEYCEIHKEECKIKSILQPLTPKGLQKECYNECRCSR